MQTVSLKRSTFLSTLRDVLSAAALLAACLSLLLYREDAYNGVFTGIHTCLNMLVPSLFPFVLLSCVLARSRAAALLFRPLSPVMRHIFRLPSCAAPAVLFGLTGGYPVGAKITASLYTENRLTREQAARLLCCCTSPGFAFTAYAGAQLSGGMHTGLLLFFSCLIAPLLLGFLLARFAPKPENNTPQNELPPGSFTDAVRDGVSSMVSLCGFVVVFSAILSILNGSGLFRGITGLLSRLGLTVPASGALVSFFLEVTAGISHCAYWHLAPVTAAFGLGFAGLCIHLQLFSFFRAKPLPLSKGLYLLVRLLNGLLCAAAYLILSFFFPAAAETAALGAPLMFAPAAGSLSASAALLLFSVFFLFSCMQKKQITSHK